MFLYQKIQLGNGGKSLNRYQNRNRNSVNNMKKMVDNYANKGERQKEYRREMEKETHVPLIKKKYMGVHLTEIIKVIDDDQTVQYLNVIQCTNSK
jgi:hypothetical protein